MLSGRMFSKGCIVQCQSSTGNESPLGAPLAELTLPPIGGGDHWLVISRMVRSINVSNLVVARMVQAPEFEPLVEHGHLELVFAGDSLGLFIAGVGVTDNAYAWISRQNIHDLPFR